MTKQNKLTVFKYRGRVFWRSSYYFTSISQLCISVPRSTSCTDFTVNSKFSANRGSCAGLTSSAFHDWSIEQRVSVPTFLGQLQTGCKWLRTKSDKIHQNTLINGMRLVFPWEYDRLFKSFRKRFKTKSYISTAELTNIHSAVEMFTPRHLDTNDQILNTAHDA